MNILVKTLACASAVVATSAAWAQFEDDADFYAGPVETPEKAEVHFDDPDITSADEIAFPSKETAADNARNLKREQKRRAREEKIAQKEARRREKNDKKKKPGRTGFAPESDIDIFPEDDE